jgi:hypothetical protein
MAEEIKSEKELRKKIFDLESDIKRMEEMQRFAKSKGKDVTYSQSSIEESRQELFILIKKLDDFSKKREKGI